VTVAATLTGGLIAMGCALALVVLAFALEAWADWRKDKRERK